MSGHGKCYQRPHWFTRNVFNPVVAGLTRVGVSVWGSRVLEVRGRSSGEGRLLLGRRREPFTVTEIADDDKPPILRAYLERWKFEVGVFFGGVGPDSSDEELRRIAPDHPVFRIGPARP